VIAEPPLVRRALALAAGLGWERSCSAEAGRLLHALAAQRGRTRVGEIGTGCGVGTAWLVSALPPGVPLLTAEVDARLAGAAAGLFASDPDVRVLHGDWWDTFAGEAPFDLLFVDAAAAKADVRAAGLLAPGGTAVLDDLAPGHEGADPVRELWLGGGALLGVEFRLSAQEAAIVAVRAL
jgi:predicted O-methyltransferase YrrM